MRARLGSTKNMTGPNRSRMRRRRHERRRGGYGLSQLRWLRESCGRKRRRRRGGRDADARGVGDDLIHCSSVGMRSFTGTDVQGGILCHLSGFTSATSTTRLRVSGKFSLRIAAVAEAGEGRGASRATPVASTCGDIQVGDLILAWQTDPKSRDWPMSRHGYLRRDTQR